MEESGPTEITPFIGISAIWALHPAIWFFTSLVSLTQWTWVWTTSGRWWRRDKPGVLQSVGSQSWTWLSNSATTNFPIRSGISLSATRSGVFFLLFLLGTLHAQIFMLGGPEWLMTMASLFIDMTGNTPFHNSYKCFKLSQSKVPPLLQRFNKPWW